MFDRLVRVPAAQQTKLSETGQPQHGNQLTRCSQSPSKLTKQNHRVSSEPNAEERSFGRGDDLQRTIARGQTKRLSKNLHRRNVFNVVFAILLDYDVVLQNTASPPLTDVATTTAFIRTHCQRLVHYNVTAMVGDHSQSFKKNCRRDKPMLWP